MAYHPELPIKDLAPGSIVQMSDGRIGYVSSCRQYVMFEPGKGHQAKEGETFKLIHWPIQLALMWLEKYQTRQHAFRCGWDAYERGDTMHANHFIQFSHTWHEWRRGFSEARDAKVIQTVEHVLQPDLGLDLDEIERETRKDRVL